MAYKFLIILIYINIIKVKWEDETSKYIQTSQDFPSITLFYITCHNKLKPSQFNTFSFVSKFYRQYFFSMSKSSNTVNMIDFEVEMIEPIF